MTATATTYVLLAAVWFVLGYTIAFSGAIAANNVRTRGRRIVAHAAVAALALGMLTGGGLSLRSVFSAGEDPRDTADTPVELGPDPADTPVTTGTTPVDIGEESDLPDSEAVEG